MTEGCRTQSYSGLDECERHRDACRTALGFDSIEFVVRKCTQCSAGKSKNASSNIEIVGDSYSEASAFAAFPACSLFSAL